MKAKQILEAYKKLKGIKEDACANCESEECKCEPSDEKKPVEDSEEQEEVEIGEPEVLESEEDEEGNKEISESGKWEMDIEAPYSIEVQKDRKGGFNVLLLKNGQVKSVVGIKE